MRTKNIFFSPCSWYSEKNLLSVVYFHAQKLAFSKNSLSCLVPLVVMCATCMSISSSSAGIVSQVVSFTQCTLKHFDPCIMATSHFFVLQHKCIHSCIFFTGPRSLKIPANWPPLRVTLYSMSSCPQLYSSSIVCPNAAKNVWTFFFGNYRRESCQKLWGKEGVRILKPNGFPRAHGSRIFGLLPNHYFLFSGKTLQSHTASLQPVPYCSKVYNATQWINLYPVNSALSFVNTYYILRIAISSFDNVIRILKTGPICIHDYHLFLCV